MLRVGLVSGWLAREAASIRRRESWELWRALGEAGLSSADLSNWTALKLKAIPATRWRVRRGVGRQQHSLGSRELARFLENVFFLPVGTHGE